MLPFIKKAAIDIIKEKNVDIKLPPEPANDKKMSEDEIIEHVFSTTFRTKKQIEEAEIESILANIKTITQDNHICDLDSERIMHHADKLDNHGIYLVVNKEQGYLAVPHRVFIPNLTFG